MEALLPIELEVMILRIATTMRLPLDESQHHRLLQLNELDEFENVDGSPYPDHINHEKLKKNLDM
jgi:hypothetical protein